MKVNEIFRSIQGESSYAGIPCVFIRFTGCNLRCSYCDTKYAYNNGTEMSTEKIISEVTKLYKEGDSIEITGGEPLMQLEETEELIKFFNTLFNMHVLIETNGSILLPQSRDSAIRQNITIMDWKCPSSGMSHKMEYENLNRLDNSDELKFVIETDEDYDFMKKLLDNKNLLCKILVSTTWKTTKKKRQEFVERILKDGLKVKFQIQLHKLIWDIKKRGV